jgi:hypothetical protein
MSIALSSPVMKGSLVTEAIQFSWYKVNSLVSSIVIIFDMGGINSDTAFNEDVFPAAVPPANIRLRLFSIAIHRYTSISTEKVLKFISSTGVNGFSLNFLIEKELPLDEISRPSVACNLDPSGIVALTIGLPAERCFPHLWASVVTNKSNSSSPITIFVLIF